MFVDIYDINGTESNHLSVPSGSDPAKLDLPSEIKNLKLRKAKVDISKRNIVGLDSDEIESMLKSTGYALHGTKVNTSESEDDSK